MTKSKDGNCAKEKELFQIIENQARMDEKQKSYNKNLEDINKKVGWFLAAYIGFMTAILVPIGIAAYRVGTYSNTLETAVEDIALVKEDISGLRKIINLVRDDVTVLKQKRKDK